MQRTKRRSRYHLGVDVGGTFTDLVLYDPSSRKIKTCKLLTTPDDPSDAVINGIAQLLQPNGHLDEVDLVVHGTTLAANALIERKGAKTALVTTDGFRDVLETGSERRYELYDLHIDYPSPLVRRALRFGLHERILFDGSIWAPVDRQALQKIVEKITGFGIEAVAVCLMHSYMDPAHEQKVLAHLRARAPELPVSLSSQILPEIGEYARVSTTVANAYVQPLMRRYLEALSRRLHEQGYRRTLYVMASSGGTLTAKVAGDLPIRLLESGPAAGAHAVSLLARRLNRQNLLSFDMGGTTAKACVIRDGVLERTTELEAARLSRFKRGSGLIIRSPSVDIFEIGAGGGSIATVDAIGLLRVGPESAGAVPGPACYGSGGNAPTVTDSNLLLGYLDAESFLGGTMSLDVDAASRAIQERVAAPLGCSLVEAARGIYDVINQNMADAIAIYGAERGIDLRNFALVAFGGAGPVHAWQLAKRLRLREIIVPPAAGLLSAVGCITAPISFEFARSYKRELEAVDWEHVQAIYKEMESLTETLLREAGARTVRMARACDMRYRGQRYDVTVPLSGLKLSRKVIPQLVRRFKSAYLKRYGRDVPGVPPEVVTWRLTGVAGGLPTTLPKAPSQDRAVVASAAAARIGSRGVFFADANGFVTAPVYDRYSLAPGALLRGPAIIVERETTIVIPPGGRCHITPFHDAIIMLERQ